MQASVRGVELLMPSCMSSRFQTAQLHNILPRAHRPVPEQGKLTRISSDWPSAMELGRLFPRLCVVLPASTPSLLYSRRLCATGTKVQCDLVMISQYTVHAQPQCRLGACERAHPCACVQLWRAAECNHFWSTGRPRSTYMLDVLDVSRQAWLQCAFTPTTPVVAAARSVRAYQA